MVLTSQVPYKAAKQNLARGTNMEATSFRIARYLPKIFSFAGFFSRLYSHWLLLTDAPADWRDTPDYGLTTTLIFGQKHTGGRFTATIYTVEIVQKVLRKFWPTNVFFSYIFHTGTTLKLKTIWIYIILRITCHIWKCVFFLRRALVGINISKLMSNLPIHWGCT